LTDYETLLPLHHTSRFSNVFFNSGKVIFEAHIVAWDWGAVKDGAGPTI
jgi:hypothetical protein